MARTAETRATVRAGPGANDFEVDLAPHLATLDDGASVVLEARDTDGHFEEESASLYGLLVVGDSTFRIKKIRRTAADLLTIVVGE